MDLKELETFVKVAEFRNFSKAAEDLKVTQPTITNHIQNLEKKLNSILMDRRGREVVLTESGKLLHKYAIDILNSCAMAQFEIGKSKETIDGTLYIESCAVPRKYLLPNLLDSFLRENPEVRFNITGSKEGNSIEKLRDRKLDFAIIGYRTEDEDIEFIEVLEEDVVLVVPKETRFENYSAIDPRELLNLKLMFKEKSNRDFEYFCSKLEGVGIDIDDIEIIGYCDDLDAIKSLVSLGIGSTFLTKKSIEADVEAGKYKALYIKGLDSSRRFYLSYYKNRDMHIVDYLFKNHILEMNK